MKKIMKMFIVLMAIMSVFGLASCKDKEEKVSPYNALGEFTVGDETNVYSFATNTTEMVDIDYTKLDDETHRDAYIKKTISSKTKLNNYQKLVITVSGMGDVKIELVAGTTTLSVSLNVVENDSTYEWNLLPHKDLLKSVKEIRVYGAAGRINTTGQVAISKLTFDTTVADGFIIQTDFNNVPSNVNEYNGKDVNFDFNAKWAENGEDGVYTIEQNSETKAVEVSYKKSAGNEWSCIVSQVRGKFAKFKYVVVVAQGTEGKNLLIKAEGEGVAKETNEKFDGTKQTFVLDISTFTEEQKNAIAKIVLFGSPNAVQDGRFTVYEAYMSETSPIEIEEIHKNIYNGTDEEFDISNYWYDGSDKVYTVEKVSDGLKVTFTKKGEYSTLKAYLQGDFSNFKYLVVEASSTSESSILLKAADGHESGVTKLGTEKTVVYVDITKVPNLTTLSEVIIFGNPGSTSAGELTIHKAYFANEVKGVEMPSTNTYDKFYESFDINHYWADNNTGTYTVTEEGSKTIISYTKHPGCEWTTFKTTIENLTNEFKYIKLVVKGTGTQILLKPNNDSAYEKWVDLTGEEQTIYAAIPANMTEMHLFCEPGKAGNETGTLEILEASLVRDVIVGDKTTDVAQDFFTSEENIYQITKTDNGIKVDYSKPKENWSTIKVLISGANKDINSLKLMFKGVKGQQILVKLNDNNVYETWIDLSGENQEVTLDDTNLPLPLTSILIFIAPNTSEAVTGTFELNSVELSKEVKTTPIVGSYSDCSNEYFYQIKENADGTLVTVGYDVAKPGWYFFKLTLDEKMTNVDKLYMTFISTDDVRILIKPNDNGSLEEYIDVTTTEYTFTKTISGDLETVLIFVSPEVAGKMGNLTITKVGVTFIEGPVTNEYTSGDSFNINKNWFDAGDKVYNVETSGTDTIVNFEKGELEWPSAKVLISGVTNQFNYLAINILGTDNLELLVKSVSNTGNVEKRIVISESEKVFYVEIIENVQEILIFAAPGEKNVNGTFTIKSADLKYATAVENELHSVLRTNDLFTVTKEDTMMNVSFTGKNTWDSVYGNVVPFATTGKKINVTVTSNNVKEILVKFNNDNGYQTTINLTDNAGNAVITNLPSVITEVRLFANFNAEVTDGTFKISMIVENAGTVELTWTPKDNNTSTVFTFNQTNDKIEVAFNKTDTYQSMKLESSIGVKGTKLKLTLSSDEAHKIMVKPNDKYETVFDITSTETVYTIDFTVEETISFIVIMVNTDVQTSEGSFTIHSIVIE